MINEFIYPLRVHIEDTDFSGVVYHSNYLNFMERARSEWAEKLGFGLAWCKQNHILFVVRSAKIDYLKPTRLHEHIEVVSRIKSIRPASIIYDQHLRLAGVEDTILCKAEIKIACVDVDMRPCALPPSFSLETMRRIVT